MTPSTLADMMTGRDLHVASPTDTVRTACIKMSSANIGALPVVDDNGFLVGMISERDVIKRSVIVYRPSEETPVSQVMTPNPKWLPPSAETSEAVQMMLNHRFRHMPICNDGLLVGIVSIRDFNLQDGSIYKAPQRVARFSANQRRQPAQITIRPPN